MAKWSRWLLLMVFAAPSAAAADPVANGLSAARELYASADYDGALAALEQFGTAGAPIQDILAVAEYRALCYLALGRSGDAERAVESLVAAAPLYRPAPGTDASPKFLATFGAVRRRVLPTLLRQKYAAAKAAFDSREYAAATAAFREILRLADDADLAGGATDGSLADVKVLAAGFVDLGAEALKAAAPANVPVASPLTRPTAGASAGKSPATQRQPVTVFTAGNTAVAPPVVVNQRLPPYPLRTSRPLRGTLEVTIDESGSVAAARLVASTDSIYDALALAAARGWRYQPATLDGQPVRYRKLVNLLIAPNP